MARLYRDVSRYWELILIKWQECTAGRKGNLEARSQ